MSSLKKPLKNKTGFRCFLANYGHPYRIHSICLSLTHASKRTLRSASAVKIHPISSRAADIRSNEIFCRLLLHLAQTQLQGCRAAGHVTLVGLSVLPAIHAQRQLQGQKMRQREKRSHLPSVHGEVSVEHLSAHLFPLDSAGKFQVCELVSQQVWLHKALRMDGTRSEVGL